MITGGRTARVAIAFQQGFGYNRPMSRDAHLPNVAQVGEPHVAAPDSLTPGRRQQPGTPVTRAWWFSVLAVLLSGGVLLATAVSVSQTWYALVLPALLALWAAPGVWLLRRAYREHRQAWAFACLFGAPVGYLLSSLCLLAAWMAGARTGWLLVAAPVVAGVLATAMPSLGRGLALPRFGRRDLLVLAALLLVVPLVVARPYSRVGADIPTGRAYRAYFTADFVWTMAVVSEVSKGDVLPENPYHLDMPLHYYWLAHLMPAVQHRVIGRAVRLDHLLLANQVFSAAAFATFLYGLARHTARSPIPAGLGCVVALLCSSPEGLYALADFWRQGMPLSLVRYLNIDAVSRWYFGTLPIDGLQRLLLYQPQHQIGYALSATALLVLVHQARRPTVKAAGLAGAVLAGGLLISTFSALMVAVMMALIASVAVVRRRAWRVGVLQAAVAAVPLCAAVWLTRRLEYVVGDRVIDLGLNPLAAVRPYSGLFISLGPVAVVLLAGLWVAVRRRRPLLNPHVQLPLVATVVSVAFYYFVDVRDHQDVYVGWRAGHLILITCAGALGWLWWRAMHRRGGGWQVAGVFGFVVVAFGAGAPTAAIDLYNSQDITNFQMAAGFPWTLALGHDELRALRWVQTQTPPDARVQICPLERDPATWAYIPAFGERRMSGGLPISMIPLKPYQQISDRVHRMYDLSDPAAVRREALALKIDVLVVGAEEHRRHPHFRELLDRNPQAFTALYRGRNVSLYGVSARMRAAASSR